MFRSSRKKRFFMFNLGFVSLCVLVFDHIDWPKAEPVPAFYCIRDLGINKLPNAINDLSQVVGMMDAGKDMVRAFVWDEELEFQYIGDDESIANGVNKLGVVVGHSGTRPGERTAFQWKPDSGFAPIQASQPVETIAYDINSKGAVVGQVGSGRGDSLFMGFVYHPETGIRRLDTFGGESGQAAAVSDKGVVVGWAKTKDNREAHAFRWSSENGMTDLGTLGGMNSYANALNERGTAVGSSQTSQGQFHAFVYREEEMTDLGTLGGTWSLACDINDKGVVVGQSDLARPTPNFFEKKGRELIERFVNLSSQTSDFHAVIWKEGALADLNDMIGDHGEWDTLSNATAINNQGQIAGYGLKDGRVHGFLLTPKKRMPQSSAQKALRVAWAGNPLSRR